MRVTLVRPPFYSLIGVSNASHPLSLGYLSASLIEAAHDVSVVDGEAMKLDGQTGLASAYNNFRTLMFPYSSVNKNARILEEVMNDCCSDTWNSIVKSIVDTRPDVVGITCFTSSMSAVKIIVKRLLEAAPDIKIVLGGIHIASMPEEALRNIEGVTCVVIGEGERTIVELCDRLGSNKPKLNDIKGLAFLSKDKEFIKTESRELIANLDELPLPTRQWPGHTYSSHLGFTSRGCPYTCNFCDSRSIWTRKVRYVSMNRIAEELAQIDSLKDPFFRYSDDTFTLSRERTTQWCDLVRKNGYNKRMKFGFGTRVELITNESVEDYASAGVMDISFGIETGSKRISKLISKDFHDTDPYEAVKAVNEAGIGTRTYFMIGHPQERPEDVEDTLTLIKKMSSLSRNYVEVNVNCPYPGTELWGLALERTGGKPFVDIDTYYKMFHQGSPIVNLTDMSDDELNKYIRILYKTASMSVLKSRSMIWGKQLLTNPFSTIKFIKKRIMN